MGEVMGCPKFLELSERLEAVQRRFDKFLFRDGDQRKAFEDLKEIFGGAEMQILHEVLADMDDMDYVLLSEEHKVIDLSIAESIETWLSKFRYTYMLERASKLKQTSSGKYKVEMNGLVFQEAEGPDDGKIIDLEASTNSVIKFYRAVQQSIDAFFPEARSPYEDYLRKCMLHRAAEAIENGIHQSLHAHLGDRFDHFNAGGNPRDRRDAEKTTKPMETVKELRACVQEYYEYGEGGDIFGAELSTVPKVLFDRLWDNPVSHPKVVAFSQTDIDADDIRISEEIVAESSFSYDFRDRDFMYELPHAELDVKVKLYPARNAICHGVIVFAPDSLLDIPAFEEDKELLPWVKAVEDGNFYFTVNIHGEVCIFGAQETLTEYFYGKFGEEVQDAEVNARTGFMRFLVGVAIDDYMQRHEPELLYSRGVVNHVVNEVQNRQLIASMQTDSPQEACDCEAISESPSDQDSQRTLSLGRVCSMIRSRYSYREINEALLRLNFNVARVKGSHHTYEHEHYSPYSLPTGHRNEHPKPGLLTKFCRSTGLDARLLASELGINLRELTV